MKIIITYIYILFATSNIFAQIDFNVVKQDVTCNRTALGDVEVNVVITNPPYVYLWNTGDTTNSINDLNEGNYSSR